MDFRKIISSTLACALLIGGAVFAAPSVSQSGDSIEVAEQSSSLAAEKSVAIDIGARASESNLRYAEIDGVQTLISEKNNTYTVTVGSEDMLVEIVEKTSADAETVVKTQYFYIDAVKKTVKALDKMDTYMQSYEDKAIRVVDEMGVRFKAHVLTKAKYEETQFYVDEYGYIVSTEEALGDEELTFNSSKYVKGVGFSKKDGINIVFDGTDDELDVFVLVVKNIPVSNYEQVLVTKTYTKLTVYGNQFVVYGEPLHASVYDIASGMFTEDCSNTKISKIMFEHFEYKGADSAFTNSAAVSSVDSTSVSVSASFTASGSIGNEYNIYLAEYDTAGVLVNVHKSNNYTVISGENSANTSFTIDSEENLVKSYVVTEDNVPVCIEKNVMWIPASAEFYDDVESTAFTSDTVYADYFNPDSEISVIEGIALVSNTHARYNDTDLHSIEQPEYYYIDEFDDASKYVDLNERNSRNDNGVNLARAEGGIDEENGYLYGSSVATAAGAYDPQIVIKGLELDARRYNKVRMRLKYEAVDGGHSISNIATNVLQLFFGTNTDSSFTEQKSSRYNLRNISDVSDWFEVEFEMAPVTGWTDIITTIRIDPFNKNGKFYLDYVEFLQSDVYVSENWYDTSLDYAYSQGIIEMGKYFASKYEDSITRQEFLIMLATAFPEREFVKINSVSALPDVEKNEKYSDIYLTLYNAGITLGFEDGGKVGLSGALSRSEGFAVLNRLLVPVNRLKGSVNASWERDEYCYDIEFNSADDLDRITLRKLKNNTTASVTDGRLVYDGQEDSGLFMSNVSIDVDAYTKVRVRIKPEYDVEPTTDGEISWEIYYQPAENYSGNITDYHIREKVYESYLDPFGWYIIDVDCKLQEDWNGFINYFRFDPMNAAGKYTIDYVRFLWSEYSVYSTPEELVEAGYEATRLFPDEYFERGFTVEGTEDTLWNDYCPLINPDYVAEDTIPYWIIGPWYHGTPKLVEGQSENVIELYDLWENRDTTTDEYTLADLKGINVIKYDPTNKSISQTLNCSKIYNGDPHIEAEYNWWPHQLLEIDESRFGTVDPDVFTANADRMFVEIDVRLTNFEDKDSHNVSTAENPYRKVCSYLIYFYLRPIDAPKEKIWFGMSVFNGSNLSAPTTVRPGWAPDSAAHQYMYGIRQASFFDGIENSFNPSSGTVDDSGEWKKIRLDVTPHIDRAVEWANRDNIFGFEVTKEDMYFTGVNIGFESAGNYDCTIEFKNFNLVAYNKPE